MKQRQPSTPLHTSNDNEPSTAEPKNMEHVSGTSHLYVQTQEKHAAKRGNGPRGKATWTPTQIYTDLPEALPVLPEEIALLRGAMGDLVSRIIANDNEPQ